MNEYARRAAWYQLGAVAENKRAGILAARGLDTSTPDVAKIHDFMPGTGRTAADRDAAARVM
jgi:hypothetical protein